MRKYCEVPLNASARKALREWLEVRPDDASDALFLSQKGGALSERGVSARVAALAKAAGLEEVSVHVLRHSFGRPFGRLVTASQDAARRQGRVFSPWRFGAPRSLGLVSFQGT